MLKPNILPQKQISMKTKFVFKMRDKNFEAKFAPLMKDSHKLPWFKTDKGHYLLKVKTKYSKVKELKKEETVLLEVVFKYYKMNEMEGFYVCSIA